MCCYKKNLKGKKVIKKKDMSHSYNFYLENIKNGKYHTLLIHLFY